MQIPNFHVANVLTAVILSCSVMGHAHPAICHAKCMHKRTHTSIFFLVAFVFQSDLLEHQRAQQLQQQQQSVQQPLPPHHQQQQMSLQPHSKREQQPQHTLPQSQAPANLPHPTATHQLQQLQNQATASVPIAPSPLSTQAAVSSQTPSLTPAMTGGASSLVGSGRAVTQEGVLQPSTVPAPVRTTLPVGGGVHGEDSQPAKTAGLGLGQGVGVATAQQQRPILPAPSVQPATQNINTAGLNMLAAVGARQQHLQQQQQQQQQQRQQAASTQQPALIKVSVLVQFGRCR